MAGLDPVGLGVYCTRPIDPAILHSPAGSLVLNAFTETALRIAVEFLKHEGLDAEFTEAGARLGVDEAVLEIETLHDEESEHPELPGELLRTVSLRFLVRTGPGAPPAFGNPINGLGETLKDSLAMAASIWVEGDLPTIRALFSGEVGRGTQVVASGHDWQVEPWAIFLGAYQFGGSHIDELTEFVRETPPFLALRDLLENDLEPDGVHWITISGFRSDAGRAFAKLDCWLDGETWEAGAEALLGVPWPELSGGRFMRQFLALVPASAVEVVSDSPR